MSNDTTLADRAKLLPCPFCGGDGVQTFTCGAAVPDCPRCSDIFGCNHCDVWFDTAEEWNTRVASAAVAEERKRIAGELRKLASKDSSTSMAYRVSMFVDELEGANNGS